MINLINKLRQKEQGQSLVELALVLPVLILLLFGIMEFGRVFHSYLVITNAAREGARSGVISKDITAIKDEVKNAATGIDESELVIKTNPSTPADAGTGAPLTVSIDYEVELFTPVLENIIPNPFPVSASCTMRVE